MPSENHLDLAVVFSANAPGLAREDLHKGGANNYMVFEDVKTLPIPYQIRQFVAG